MMAISSIAAQTTKRKATFSFAEGS
jgi:hypothetical protein